MLPKVGRASWPRNPIDSFVLERLQREGLTPSPEAGRETLLRRVTLDLTGLAPSPAELDAFLKDRSPEAFEKVVDRLLASPRYGERMAARWLDAARYADSNGYQYDGERVMWPWRDWVIRAFHRNQPFDQFVLEQIACDLLPGASRDQKIATGFNRNHRANTEDGIIPEEYAAEYVVDRLETASTVFLGLTMGCARCHNHKYDPFTQKEFYQLFAYFNNVPELGRAMKYGNSPPLIPAPTREQQAAWDHLQARLERLRESFDRREKSLRRLQRDWENRIAPSEPRPNGAEEAPLHWAPAEGLELLFSFEGSDPPAKTTGGQLGAASGSRGRAGVFDGRTHLDAGRAAGFDIQDRFTLAAWVFSDQAPDGSLISRMADNPKGKGYGVHLREGRVHAHLTSVWADDAIRLETEETLQAGRWHHVAVTYTGSRMAEGVRVYIDGRPATVKVLMDTLYRPFRNAGNEVRDPLRIGGGEGPSRRFRGRLDEARIYSRVLDEQEIAALALDQSLQSIAARPAAQRSAVESLALRSFFLEQAAPEEARDAWKQHNALLREREKLERSFPTVMVMAERPEPRDTFLLTRGAYDKPGEKVLPGLPAVLPPLPPGAPNNRLGFARWLVGPANPLTARVAANRFWQMYFGAGLVKTAEDFGSQGESPSHPDLLDWLAAEFVRSRWDVKALQKLIVTSATYRQSSQAAPAVARKDPENRLLARGPRFRLPAEMIRDQALFAAGLLVDKLGGPPVKPYQPPGLWKEIAMQDTEYLQGKGEDLYRRSLYTYWKRTAAPPMLVNFDSAMRESCVVREGRTNTPLQALNLMNDVTFLEAARFIGQRMIREGGAAVEDRLRRGFLLVLARRPSTRELELTRASLAFHLDYFASRPEQVRAYLSHGETPPDPSLDPRELAAYASLASLLLNLDEAVTKE